MSKRLDYWVIECVLKNSLLPEFEHVVGEPIKGDRYFRILTTDGKTVLINHSEIVKISWRAVYKEDEDGRESGNGRGANT